MDKLVDFLAKCAYIYIHGSPATVEVVKTFVAGVGDKIHPKDFSDPLHAKPPALQPYKYH